MVEFFYATGNSIEYVELRAHSAREAISLLPEDATILFMINARCATPVWTRDVSNNKTPHVAKTDPNGTTVSV